jgi:hypothetical protein
MSFKKIWSLNHNPDQLRCSSVVDHLPSMCKALV